MIDLSSYFNPLSADFYSDKDNWQTTQIARGIDTHIEEHFPNIKFAEIAIFSVNEYEGSRNIASKHDCKIRYSLYSFHHNNLPRIADLGVLKLMSSRKESFSIIR